MLLQKVSGIAFLLAGAAKALVAFGLVMLAVVILTWLERRLAGFIQDRKGPNRVGPLGLLQPVADGLKNFLKEETWPERASKIYFLLGPMLALMPALVLFAVVPFAGPLPTPWGVVDMIAADVPIGILYVLAIASLGVYGLVIGGWASNNKYAFLGGLRASAQMVSYEVALGMSLVTVLMLSGNVSLPEVVWDQQQMGLWYVFPLSLGFLLFMIAGFAETNRLPFDLPEAESELIVGYHTEYSSMKFAMFMLGEYAHMFTTAALLTTLFFGGWDIPFWSGDDFFWHQGTLIQGFTEAGEPIAANPAWWKTLLTFGAFVTKTGIFCVFFILVRWTLPRFRYDQVMHLGWKVMIPAVLAYIVLIGGTILVLDTVGVTDGLGYGLALTGVSAVATAAFLWVVDRDRIIGGADVPGRVRPHRGLEGAALKARAPRGAEAGGD